MARTEPERMPLTLLTPGEAMERHVPFNVVRATPGITWEYAEAMVRRTALPYHDLYALRIVRKSEYDLLGYWIGESDDGATGE